MSSSTFASALVQTVGCSREVHWRTPSDAPEGPVDGEGSRSIFEDADRPLGFDVDDEWPPHFGAARAGIP